MYDQSFSIPTLKRMIRKGDFKAHPSLYVDANKDAEIAAAFMSAHSDFGGAYPLASFVKGEKRIYTIPVYSDELVLRKLTLNIKWCAKVRQPNRTAIISNLIRFMEEGVPYRIYRLDIKSFYESFETSAILARVDSLVAVSPQSKRLLRKLLAEFLSSGGVGLPRGLALSAVLSDLMMSEFDKRISSRPGVYFYARYVDDIIIATNGNEIKNSFLKHIKNLVAPLGLSLNPKKQKIRDADKRVKPLATNDELFTFDYLGYKLSVTEPTPLPKTKPTQQFRRVVVDISKSKLARSKTRVVRSFIDFCRTLDYDLLHERLLFLTSNFAVKDINRPGYKLAGIYYNYPHITRDTAIGLKELDRFLMNSIRSKHGRVSSESTKYLSSTQKRKLLTLSFDRGHLNKTFLHFHPSRIHVIQKCWENE
jgi:hypothetical protein